MKLTIMVGCYNEKPTILKAINEARSIEIDKEIIVIDNCSTDGTREILEDLNNDQDLRIIFHSNNMGVGYSASEGIKLAKGDYFYAPGADLEYKMSDLNAMLEKMENEKLDVVLGSRLINRNDMALLSLIKERPYWLGTIISTFLINLLYHREFTDVIGIFLIRTSILKEFNVRANGPAFTFGLISKLVKCGYKIKEVPVYYKPRTHKEGKTIRVLDMLPAIWEIFKVKFLPSMYNSKKI